MPLPRQHRLRRPEQFARVRRDGKSWAHPLFILNAARNRVGRTRVGFVVSKQLGKAHDRNRAKRRVSEALRLVRASIAPGWDLVIVIRQPATIAPFTDLQRALKDVLRRASLWQAQPQQEATDATPSGSGDDSPVPTLLSPDTT